MLKYKLLSPGATQMHCVVYTYIEPIKLLFHHSLNVAFKNCSVPLYIKYSAETLQGTIHNNNFIYLSLYLLLIFLILSPASCGFSFVSCIIELYGEGTILKKNTNGKNIIKQSKTHVCMKQWRQFTTLVIPVGKAFVVLRHTFMLIKYWTYSAFIMVFP